jgi:acetyltransferase
MWLEMFQSFSEESIRYRFFQMLKDTPHEVRVRYCNIDYDREMAIVAEVTSEGRRKILGVTRLIAEPDGKTGELAFIVGDNWQDLGLGTKMVDHVLDIAKEMGIEEVYAIMLTDNYRAISLTKKMGFCLEDRRDGTAKGTLNLKEELPETIRFQPSSIDNPAPTKEQAQVEEDKEAKQEAQVASGES